MSNRLLIKLLSDNRREYLPMQQRIVAAGDDAAGEATVYLYDAIVGDRLTAEWWGGVCPQDFVPAFRAIKADVIHLRINSPGGEIFAAEAMCQALRDHPARVVAHIEGLAASAATTIACAADEVIISAGSKYMIHNAWCFAMGNAGDMRAMAELLDSCDATMIAEYARRTGNDTQRLTDWCNAETWFNAQEAVEHGFADSIAEAAPKAQATWNLSAYKHAPAGMQTPAPAPAAPAAIGADHRIRQQQRTRAALLTRIE